MALIRGLATHLTLDRKLILASTAHLSILRPKVPGWISHDSCWWCSCSHINLIVYINVYNIRLIYSIYIFFLGTWCTYIYIYIILYYIYTVHCVFLPLDWWLPVFGAALRGLPGQSARIVEASMSMIWGLERPGIRKLLGARIFLFFLHFP